MKENLPSHARIAAVSALNSCLYKNAFSQSEIEKNIAKYSLAPNDASLFTKIFLGTLQNLYVCDRHIKAYSERSTDSLDDTVRSILETAFYQLLFLDKVPARAVVNDAVSLAGYFRLKSSSGFVNAVLRSFLREPEKVSLPMREETARFLSGQYSAPIWLCERLADERGFETAEAFLKASQDEPDIFVNANTLKISPEDFEKELSGYLGERSRYADYCWKLKASGNIRKLPGYEEGHFYVQNPSAKAVSRMADIKPGDNILDACAAPGGKSVTSAIKMRNRGKILSCDISEAKLRRIEENASRLGTDIIDTRCMDASVFCPEFFESFDTVIADVPCSGLGVIKSRPEIKYKKKEEIAALPEIQKRIALNLKNYVKAGGQLVYSTCTVLKAENEELVRGVLEESPELTLENEKLILPTDGESDGFYIAVLRKGK